jgi:hypothetical protein
MAGEYRIAKDVADICLEGLANTTKLLDLYPRRVSNKAFA